VKQGCSQGKKVGGLYRRNPLLKSGWGRDGGVRGNLVRETKPGGGKSRLMLGAGSRQKNWKNKDGSLEKTYSETGDGGRRQAVRLKQGRRGSILGKFSARKEGASMEARQREGNVLLKCTEG